MVRYPNQRRFFTLALNPYYMLVANPQRLKAAKQIVELKRLATTTSW